VNRPEDLCFDKRKYMILGSGRANSQIKSLSSTGKFGKQVNVRSGLLVSIFAPRVSVASLLVSSLISSLRVFLLGLLSASF